jgi:hypothetical protein
VLGCQRHGRQRIKGRRATVTPGRSGDGRIARVRTRWDDQDAMPMQGAARIVRDTILPVIFKVAANSKQARRPFDHHIDWDTPISAPTGTQ